MVRCLVAIGLLLLGQVAARAAEDLKTEVRRLVGQLDAPQLIQREAAEAELLRRGPAVLDVLPTADDRMSAEVQQRLGRIRQRLQHVAADAATGNSTITLNAADMRLSEILRAFQEQSGNPIIDYRRQFGQPASDPKLTIRFDKTPFWPALDQLLDQAGLMIYSHVQERSLHVVAASGEKKKARVSHASYSGPFRFEPVLIVAQRNLRETNSGSIIVNLDVAWEPRLAVIMLMQRMADVQAVDERGDPLTAENPNAQPEMPISGERPAVHLDLRFQLPPRTVQRIASLKGKLLATIPGRIETFRFGKLAGAKNVERRIAGVTVTLEQVRLDKAATGGRASQSAPQGPANDHSLPKGEGTMLEIRMRARFDEAGDALASHRQWIFSNPAYLERPDGKPIAYDSFETTSQSKNEVGLAFLFSTDRPLDELTFVYKTPGSIVTSGFEYELKDIRLP